MQFDTIKIRRGDTIFQVSRNPLSGLRYSVHNSNQGATWSNLESLDVNQPHGLDYRQENAIAAGVRKRILKEHLEFTDATVGGEHLPGVARVINKDTSANIDTSWGSGYLRGSGLQWNPTTGRFYCATIDGSDNGVADMTVIGYSPWADATWTGIHQFDASVDMTALCIQGSFCVAGHIVCASKVEVTGSLLCDDSVDVAGFFACGSYSSFLNTVTCLSKCQVYEDITIKKGLLVDGTSVLYGNLKVAGDVSMADITGTVRQRFASAWGNCDWTTGTITGSYNVNSVSWCSDGIVCISFATALPSANYAVIFTNRCSSADSGAFNTILSVIKSSVAGMQSPVASGFRVVQVDAGSTGGSNEISEFYFITIGI